MFSALCNRLRTPLAVLAAILVLLHAKEAWVSGSHAIRFLEPNLSNKLHTPTEREVITERRRRGLSARIPFSS